MPRRRPDRIGQVDAAPRRERPGTPLHRRHAVRTSERARTRHPRAPATRPRGCRRLRRSGPARGFRHRHGRRGARVRHGAARPRTRGDAQARRRDARPARAGRPAPPPAARPVGRAATACRDRVGAHHPPACAGPGRTHFGAGSDCGRRGSSDHHQTGARPRRDGAARRAPDRAGAAVCRRRRPPRTRGKGHVWRSGGSHGHVVGGPAGRRARSPRRVGPAAAVGA